MTLEQTKTVTTGSPITVEHVPCPGCGADGGADGGADTYTLIGSGPDYENACCGDQRFTMVQCSQCSIFYLNPRPTTDMLPIIYPADGYICYNFSEKSSSLVARARERRNFNKVKPVLKYVQGDLKDLRVLDIGAGDGTLLRILQSGGIPAENLTGVDIDTQAVEGLRRQGFNGVQARAEDMDFPQGSFDLVTISHVIEHVADPRRVMELAFRALKPGGVFWLETPNIAGWDWNLFKKGTWGGYHFPRHWTLFTPRTISRMLTESGFEVAEVSTLSATFVWVWSINHVLQERGAKGAANFFRLDNFLALGFFWIFDMLPSMLGKSSNMRAVARKKA
ncbi:MAG: class I SAM-dependent methyltransferase [bacterium]|nr:class I SAM-dependent methyltransferase [bacterium]